MDTGSGDALLKAAINPAYLTKEFADGFKGTLAGTGENSTPFPHFALRNFVSSAEFVSKLRRELLTADWHRKENDLYSLSQTPDIANFDPEKFPLLDHFKKFLYNDVRNWLKDVSGVNLNTKVAITGSEYANTDLLLPHDDQLEGRAFAFIIYLTPNWKPEYGGQLNLYNTGDDNRPISLAKALSPEENTFMMFRVSPRSWHMVTEVLVENVNRLSINGWFHSDDVIPPPSPAIVPTVKEKPNMDITYEEVLEWINPEYIAPEEQKKVEKIFIDKSEIDLINFLREDKYNEALNELEKCDFESIGPLEKRKVERLREYSLPKDSCLKSLLRLLRSRAMTLLLTQWTGLPLHPVLPQSDDEEPDAKKTKLEESEIAEELNNNVEYISTLDRFSKGSFTMADDQLAVESEKNGYCLDMQLFFCKEKWNDDHGGFTVYIAKDEEGEILRVSPVGNSAALVFREPDVFSFVKYINSCAEDRHFYVLNCSYFGIDTEGEDDQEEDDDDEEIEDESIDNGKDKEGEETGAGASHTLTA